MRCSILLVVNFLERLEMRIGVVLQGPIVSEGRTFEHLTLKRFDSSQNILDYYQTAKLQGCETVISTWSGEPVSQLASIPKEDLILTPPISHRRVSSVLNDYGNNKYKQFNSLLVGVKALQNRQCTHVIKIRSDLHIDLSELLDAILKNRVKLEEKKIAVPLLYVEKPDMFYDGYFAALTSEMGDLCKIMLEEKELFSSVHQDVFYKWALHASGSQRTIRDIHRIYRKNSMINESQMNFINNGWFNHFSVLPKILWENQVWRGEKITKLEIKRSYFFLEDFELGKTNLAALLISKITKNPSINYTSAITYFLSSKFSSFIRKIQIRVKMR